MNRPDEKMNKKNFEQALAQLEQLVTELEQDNFALDMSLKKFNEGMQLVSFCDKKLNDARNQVDLLLKKEDGGLTRVSFATIQADGEFCVQQERAE